MSVVAAATPAGESDGIGGASVRVTLSKLPDGTPRVGAARLRRMVRPPATRERLPAPSPGSIRGGRFQSARRAPAATGRGAEGVYEPARNLRAAPRPTSPSATSAMVLGSGTA